MVSAAAEDGGFVVIDSWVIVAPKVCGEFVFGPCFVMQYIFAIISLRKRELVALL